MPRRGERICRTQEFRGERGALAHGKEVAEPWVQRAQGGCGGRGWQDKPGPEHEVPDITSAHRLAQSKRSR